MFKVILVDDEVYARTGLKNLIDWQEYGYDICAEADNGEEALQLVEKIDPDVVITDIRMPVLDGLELIGTLKERSDTQCKFIIISGYNDFSYAQQAVRFGVQDFILKPIDEEELTSTLIRLAESMVKERMNEQNRSQMIYREGMEQLLSGNVDDPSAAALAQTADLETGDELCYMVVEINDTLPPLQQSKAISPKQVKTLISNILVNLTRENREPLFYEQSRWVFGFLAVSPHLKRQYDDWGQLAGEFHKALPRDLRERARLYVGRPGKYPVTVRESYHTANQAMQYKFAFSDENVILYDHVKDRELNYIEMNDELCMALMEAVEENEMYMIGKSLDRMFHEFRSRDFAPEAVLGSINRCVLGIVGIVQKMQGEEKRLPLLETVLRLHRYSLSMHGLRELVTRFVTESSDYIARLRKENANGVIQKIRLYIEMNYQENISLKSIAAKFYMNPVYLGQLFKKTFGMYFNEFLLNKRIQEAKKLLRQTDLRIYEVAEKVGFSNADYFVTQFEKVEHKTPTEYRKELLAKKS